MNYLIIAAMPGTNTTPDKPQESGEASKKEAPGIVAANGRAQERLIQASKPEKQTPEKKEEPKKKEQPVQKKPEKQPKKTAEEKPQPEKPNPKKTEEKKTEAPKKEKNWHLVRGTLSAENNDGSMGSTTTGIGIENKKGTAQIILGPTTTAERAPSGDRKEQFHPIGLTGRINF